MMPRVLVGVGAAAVGFVVYISGSTAFGFPRTFASLGFGAAIVVYTLADRFGLVPTAFGPRIRFSDLMRDDSCESDSTKEERRSSRTAETTTIGTLTVGESVRMVEDESPSTLAQRCFLCDAKVRGEVRGTEVHVECVVCGQYRASVNAARALDALVKYRVPALDKILQMVRAYRVSHPNSVPTIDVQFVVTKDTPTFFLRSTG
jgi:hypothetical protein